jgi:rRNA-processing protein FCF1
MLAVVDTNVVISAMKSTQRISPNIAEKMSSITIQIPDFLRRQVERLSAEDGLSVDQFFSAAASEKLAAIEAEGYIRHRAERANDAAFLDAIAHIPATPVSEAWDQPSQD